MGRTTAILLILVGLTTLALGWLVTSYWYPRTLPFEQKLERGYLHLAYQDARAEAALNPGKDELARLVRVLTLKGNLGRADLIACTHDIHDPLLDLLRGFQVSVLAEAKRTGTIVNHFARGELSEVSRYPVYQDLKFFVGYQHALLGDWNAAHDYFAMARRGGVSPQLKPYLQYYYARALIAQGDERDRKRGYSLLGKLAPADDRYRLSARVALNQLQSAITNHQEGFFGLYLTRIARYATSWEHAKALADIGRYFLEQGEAGRATRHYFMALARRPQNYGTKRSIALGLTVAMQQLNGDLGAVADVIVDAQGTNLLYLWVEELGEIDEALQAVEPLSQVATTSADEEMRFLAWEALSLAYSIAGRKHDLEALLLMENLAPAPSRTIQVSYLNYARLLRERGETVPARGYYESAASLQGEYRSVALFEQYMLSKQYAPRLDTAESIRLLSGVVGDPLSPHRLEACEELLALAVLAGHGDLVQSTLAVAEKLSPDVAAFWKFHLDGQAGNGKKANPRPDTSPIKRFSYYELQPLPEFRLEQAATTEHPFYLEPEHAVEYLASHFLDDLALSLSGADDTTGLPPIAAAITLRNAELTRPVGSSSWLATSLLEAGPVFDSVLLKYTLELAYPTPYRQQVESASLRYGIPAELIYAVMKKESNFNPQAVSRAGAKGLLQLMPDTASAYNAFIPAGLRSRPLTDSERNIHLGAAYLASLLTAYGHRHLVLAAYNAGPGNLNRWRQTLGTQEATFFVELIPNPETEQFVKKTAKYAMIYRWILGKQ